MDEFEPFATPSKSWRTALQFEKKITLGNLLELVIILAVVVAAFTSMQTRIDTVEYQVRKIENLQNEIVDLERRLGNQYVRTEVFAEIKVQLSDIKNEIKNLNQRR